MLPTNGMVSIQPGSRDAMVLCNDGYRPSFGFISRCEGPITWNPEPGQLNCAPVVGKYNIIGQATLIISMTHKSTHKNVNLFLA